MAGKTVVFGLDGACFELIEPWLDSLPTLSGLIDQGGRAPLESTTPATTPPAWTSLTTGVNPGKHGVFGFYTRHRDSYEISPVSDRTVHARRLWDYTSEAGLSSLIVNVPVTHPARPLDGVLVPGYTAPDTPETYPESVLSTVGHDDYAVYAPSESESVPDDQLLDEWLSLSRSRASLARALMAEYDWELLFLEFQKTDGAVHKFDDDARIRKLYECVDDAMASVLDSIDEPVNVIVVSDHGIGQPKQWAISLNTWLRDQGYLETTTDTTVQREQWLDAATGDETDDDTDRNLTEILAAAGLTRQRVERLLSAVGLYDLARQVVPQGIKDAMDEEGVDRPASRAFYESMGFSGVDTGILLNEASFYEDGILDEESARQVRQEIMDDLAALTGPAGPVFSSVKPREDVYHGDRTAYAPAIVLEQAPDYVIGSATPRGKQFIQTEPGRIDHTRTGLLIAAGPDVPDDWSLSTTPSILDVTPTLLYLLDCPLDDRFDGQALTDLVTADRSPESKTYDPYEPHADYEISDSERESLEDRLKQMGYLE